MAKGYTLSKGFLFSTDWEQALRSLSAEDFHLLFWQLYDFQKSRGVMVVPAHPQNPLLDAFASLIVPQIQNRINGSLGGGSAWGTVGGTVGGTGLKMSEDKISEDNFELREANATAPLPPAEENSLIADGIPKDYIEERKIRAADFAKAHKRNTASVLREWWQLDEKTYTKQSDGSFNTEEFFKKALSKSFLD